MMRPGSLSLPLRCHSERSEEPLQRSNKSRYSRGIPADRYAFLWNHHRNFKFNRPNFAATGNSEAEPAL